MAYLVHYEEDEELYAHHMPNTTVGGDGIEITGMFDNYYIVNDVTVERLKQIGDDYKYLETESCFDPSQMEEEEIKRQALVERIMDLAREKKK